MVWRSAGALVGAGAVGVVVLLMTPVVRGLGQVAAQAVVDQTEAEPNVRYEWSPAYPYGRPNPTAPPELAQFAFIIGEFDCIDEMRRRDGTWVRFRAIWNAHYFLNGFGVQDEYWNPDFHTSNIRIYDPTAGRWKITFFRMSGYQSGVWEGGLEGDDLVFRSGGRTSGPGLTFYDRTEDGFEWHSGGDDPGWKSTCTRRR